MHRWRGISLMTVLLLAGIIGVNAYIHGPITVGNSHGCVDAATKLHASSNEDSTKHVHYDKHNNKEIDRRNLFSRVTAGLGLVLASTTCCFVPFAHAEITKDSMWPLWPALPVAPYARRKTIRQTVVPGSVWIFDQLIGIYYVHVPIRMTVVAMKLPTPALLVYAPVAPTKECLSLLQELIHEYGPVQKIILPSVAVEHKVNAGPFARHFPKADFYAVDRQYSFPIPLPSQFLGFPSNTIALPPSSKNAPDILGPEFDYEVLTVKPGPGSEFQDVAIVHKPSKTLLVCDAIFATTEEPPAILQEEPEYTRALLFHARDEKDQVVPDTPENRKKGWRRIVLLFNFFFPGSGSADLGWVPSWKR